MCVIIIKPADIAFTSEQVEQCWRQNSDGMGLAYVGGTKRQPKMFVHKGIMKLKKAQELIASLQDRQLFIHFRFATHGAVSPKLTHPFGITESIEESCEAQDVDEVYFHNGVFQRYGGNKQTKISDTLDFCTSVLAWLPDNYERQRILDQMYGKHVIVSLDEGKSGIGTYYTAGHFEKHEGLTCSNTNWVRKTYTPGAYSGTSYGNDAWKHDNDEPAWRRQIHGCGGSSSTGYRPSGNCYVYQDGSQIALWNETTGEREYEYNNETRRYERIKPEVKALPEPQTSEASEPKIAETEPMNDTALEIEIAAGVPSDETCAEMIAVREAILEASTSKIAEANKAIESSPIISGEEARKPTRRIVGKILGYGRWGSEPKNYDA